MIVTNGGAERKGSQCCLFSTQRVIGPAILTNNRHAITLQLGGRGGTQLKKRKQKVSYQSSSTIIYHNHHQPSSHATSHKPQSVKHFWENPTLVSRHDTTVTFEYATENAARFDYSGSSVVYAYGALFGFVLQESIAEQILSASPQPNFLVWVTYSLMGSGDAYLDDLDDDNLDEWRTTLTKYGTYCEVDSFQVREDGESPLTPYDSERNGECNPFTCYIIFSKPHRLLLRRRFLRFFIYLFYLFNSFIFYVL